MSLRIEYNKTALQALEKNLKIREKALPTLQSKEAALRQEVQKARQEVARRQEALRQALAQYQQLGALWIEFEQGLLEVGQITTQTRRIAGVKIPVLESLTLHLRPFSLFNRPAWFLEGVKQLERLLYLQTEVQIWQESENILEQARKKTTQKVNLYEKVQIPAYQVAILKIKRYLEDEENLSKAAQKIVKQRIALAL
ncbi:MAG: V-type ATP synthase subunit D [Microscillaceae bacterium]|nr:V-type ATP synthase subunit D [Microscillaceae bacterium]